MGLPRIDEHTAEVIASPAETWRALITPSQDESGLSGRFASLLGCEQTEVSGQPGEEGSTVPGFRVVHSDRPRKLALAGAHRFSHYSLTFRIDETGDGRSRLRAETHAAFPGLAGQLYKTAVIRSRAHALLTRRMLQDIARRAQRCREPDAA